MSAARRRAWPGLGRCWSAAPLALVRLVAAASSDACAHADNSKPFSGITVSLLGIHWGEDFLLDGIRRWENETGGKIQWSRVTDAATLEMEITNDLGSARIYDAYVCTNKMVPRWASQGWLSILTEAVRDPALKWHEILPIFRNSIAVYDKNVVTIPWDGDVFLLYFRRDIASRDGWSAPKTWDDFIKIAQRYDGQDLNDDGEPDYGACICSSIEEPNSFYHWITPFLTMVQYEGPKQGAFLNLTDDGVKPMVDNQAFRKGIDIVRQAMGSYPVGPEQTYAKARQDFADGRCAIYFTWPSGGTWSIMTDDHGQREYMHGRMGVANIPGSEVVLDRTTGHLVQCTQELCPYAIDPATGTYDGINRISWFANGGMGTVVNNASSPVRQKAMIHFLLWYASQLDVTRPTPYNPFRTTHLDIADYTNSGWNGGDAAQYVGALEEILALKNTVLDFRLPFAVEFFNQHSQYYMEMLNGTDDEIEAAIQKTTANVDYFINEYFGKHIKKAVLPGALELERIYREALGRSMRKLSVFCDPGTGYVETNAKLKTGACISCPLGTFGPGGENQRCLPCVSGYISNQTGAEQCQPCSSGQFSLSGWSACQNCPPNTAPGAKGQDRCKCGQGFFGPGDENCTRCPSGMTTRAPDSREVIDCGCPPGTYLPSSGQVCQTCGEGLVCDFGSEEANIPATSDAPEPASRTYPKVAEQHYTLYAKPLEVYKCISRTRCLGGRPESCSESASGISCRCERGLTEKGDGSCKPCHDTFKGPLLFPIMPIVLGPFLVFYLHRFSKAALLPWASHRHGFRMVLSHAFLVIQTVGVLNILVTVGEDSGSALIKHWEFTSLFVNLMRLVKPECGALFDYQRMFLTVVCLPIACALIFMMTYFASKLVPRFAMKADTTLSCFGASFFALYIMIMYHTFSHFQCYKHFNGKYSLISSPDTFCYETVWYNLLPVNVIAILIYGIGPIAIVIYVLRNLAANMVLDDFRLRFKFVIKKFTPPMLWWQLVLLAKGMWMNLAFGLSSELLIVCILLFLGFILYTIGLAIFKPWKLPEINYLDMGTSSLLVVKVLIIAAHIASTSSAYIPTIMNISAAFYYVSMFLICLASVRFIYQMMVPPNTVLRQERSRSEAASALADIAVFLKSDPDALHELCLKSMTSEDIKALRSFVDASNTLRKTVFDERKSSMAIVEEDGSCCSSSSPRERQHDSTSPRTCSGDASEEQVDWPCQDRSSVQVDQKLQGATNEGTLSEQNVDAVELPERRVSVLSDCVDESPLPTVLHSQLVAAWTRP